MSADVTRTPSPSSIQVACSCSDAGSATSTTGGEGCRGDEEPRRAAQDVDKCNGHANGGKLQLPHAMTTLAKTEVAGDAMR